MRDVYFEAVLNHPSDIHCLHGYKTIRTKFIKHIFDLFMRRGADCGLNAKGLFSGAGKAEKLLFQKKKFVADDNNLPFKTFSTFFSRIIMIHKTKA